MRCQRLLLADSRRTIAQWARVGHAPRVYGPCFFGGSPPRKSGMKRYRAAALALVVWYLLFPPTSREHPTGDISAPLSKWQRRTISAYRKNQFPDRRECEIELNHL